MRIPKAVIQTTISAVALILLIVGGGVAYVWYSGQNSPTIAPAEAPPTASSSRTIVATKPAENAPASASVQMITSPVAPGENVSMYVKTVPTSSCTIDVRYNDIPSKDSGLIEKVADEFGTVSWTWTVDESAPEGVWPAAVTCVYNGRSAVVKGDLQISRQAS